MRDLWVDFNDLDRHGRTVTLREYAEPGVDLSIGSRLVVGDDDGNLCSAQVTDVSNDGTVLLVLDMGSFQPVDSVHRAYA